MILNINLFDIPHLYVKWNSNKIAFNKLFFQYIFFLSTNENKYKH